MLRSSAPLALALLCACPPQAAAPVGAPAAGGDLAAVMTSRGLTDADVLAAAKTYTPSGMLDEYVIFASGGHGGNIVSIGVPSMRILKYIAVFGPEPWQGYGIGGLSDAVLAGGNQGGKEITWGDVHHPNLSEQGGEYDGKYLFVNDKANARVAVVDLADWSTKQIVKNPLVMSDHGGAFVTMNTEYVVETSQYASPLGGGTYAPLSDYDAKYRGAATFWKFDKEKGRIDEAASFAVELPPYAQDLADSGKLVSHGYVFIGSWNTERSSGSGGEGKPFTEAGASKNDMDYLHIINWMKAEELIAAGKFSTINGMRIISLEVAAAENVLVLAPEPKSPHGSDVTPDGTAIVVGGKLDTHTTVFEFSKIKDLIEKGDFASKDPYGVNVLDFQKSLRGQQEIGLGPLHSVFGLNGDVYTSVFLDSTVVKWNVNNIGAPTESLPVQYNIGHITSAEGDTVSPDGHYVVAMNKMSQDRFLSTGPLLPQNFQLIDTSGPKMELIADLPIGLGEPHYAQMIKADKLHSLSVYPVGTNPYTDQIDPGAVASGKERIERNGNKVDVYMSVIRSHFTPDYIEVNQGDDVTLHLTSLEQATDQVHGFAVDMYNVNVSMEPGKYEEIHFKADRSGVFPFYCTEFCSALHLEMMGYMLVKPAGS